MIDILDDSYESDITDEEHEQLILMSEHAIAPQLSPAAQAIIGGYMKDQYGRISTYAQHNLANALRAAADQVVPDDYDPAPGVLSPTKEAFLDGKCARNEHIRSQLLAIADELEAQRFNND